MHNTQREQTIDLLHSRNIHCALFSSLDSVKWLTGFAPPPPVQMGVHHFAGGPALLWYEDKHFTLIILDAHAENAADFDGTVITYEGYTFQEPISSGRNLANALRKLLQSSKPRKIGIEAQTTTMLIQNVIQEVSPEIMFIDRWLEPLRMVKTEEELAKLRRNFQLIEVGHAKAREIVAPGLREIDVWSAVHHAINQEAGMIVPMGNDCVVGYREQNIGGWPKNYEIRPGDTLTVDLSTVYQGYWSDSCASYFASEPATKQIAIRQVVHETLEYAISLIKPGAVAKEIDAKVRGFIEKSGYPVYPHHTGHGVGVSGHEAPRIVPYSEEILQPGMVIMLEPGIYLPGELSIRMEDAMLVTADGVEILTHHDKTGVR